MLSSDKAKERAGSDGSYSSSLSSEVQETHDHTTSSVHSDDLLKEIVSANKEIISKLDKISASKESFAAIPHQKSPAFILALFALCAVTTFCIILIDSSPLGIVMGLVTISPIPIILYSSYKGRRNSKTTDSVS